jgi:transmembrane sensor
MTPHAPDDPASPDEALDPLLEQALEWQVRLHSGEDATTVARAFEAWQREDPAHRQAAERAAELWRLLGGAFPRRRRGPPSVVIALALCGVAAGAFAGGVFGPPRAWIADERTATGERRHVVLSDGTQVDLDGGTSFDIVFTPDRRRVILYAGQIYVAVQPDKARPFEVSVDGGSARALGTAFDVRREGVRTSVVVTENVVRVQPVELPDASAVELRAGQEVSFSSDRIDEVRQVDVRARTAWRQGRLVFDGRPLGEIAAAIARHRRGPVIVTDRGLESLRVTGSFLAADGDRMLDAIETALPVRILRLPLLTLIRPDPARGVQRVRDAREP